MKPVVVKLTRQIQFSRLMELDDLKKVFWGYLDDILDELIEMSEVDLHYLLFLFYSGAKSYMLYSITDPKEAPLSRGYIEAPVGGGTMELRAVAGGIDQHTLETLFINSASRFKKEA